MALAMEWSHEDAFFSTALHEQRPCDTASHDTLCDTRITNKREKACLLGAVKMVLSTAVDRAERRRARAAKVRTFVRTVGPQERKAAAKKQQLQTAICDCGGQQAQQQQVEGRHARLGRRGSRHGRCWRN
jgi:hypothetical protein